MSDDWPYDHVDPFVMGIYARQIARAIYAGMGTPALMRGLP